LDFVAAGLEFGVSGLDFGLPGLETHPSPPGGPPRSSRLHI
jgi:hypothetical protein